jgi:spermidine/putrescine transport system ATP-binding protein
MQRLLKHLQREVNITFIYITHDQGEALSLSDRIAVMNKGVLHQVGKPEEIYESPQTKFVAGFIGKTNFLSGQLVTPSQFVTDDGISVITKPNQALSGDKKAFVSIRPEKLCLTRESNKYVNQLKAMYVEEAYYGVEKEIMLELSNGTPILLKKSIRGNTSGLEVGQEVDIYFQPEDAIVVWEREG